MARAAELKDEKLALTRPFQAPPPSARRSLRPLHEVCRAAAERLAKPPRLTATRVPDRHHGEHGYDGWATIEDETAPGPNSDPTANARRSLAFLREIGIAE